MEEDKSLNFFRFEDLRIYDKALSYAEWVYHITARFEETCNNRVLSKDFLRAAKGIGIAIAEGSSRSKPHFVQLLKDAKSMARECLVMGTVLHRMQLISEEQNHENRELVMEISRMLGALIASLEKPVRKQELRGTYEEENI